MADALTPCGACDHVANHHSDRHGCQVRGCPCRAFQLQTVSLERHNQVVREANRRIASLQAEVDRLKGTAR